MLEEFNLINNEGLCQIYDIQDLWVHGHFKEDFLGGILIYVGSRKCPNLSLVVFFEYFMHIIDSQYHRERKAKNVSLATFSELKTSYEIEKYAKSICYTYANFICLRDSFA